MISRREFLETAAAAGCATTLVGKAHAAVTDQAPPLGMVLFSYAVRSRVERNAGFSDPLRFLEFCHQRGGGSVQLPLGQRDAAYCAKLSDRCAELNMGLEGAIRTPQEEADCARFEAELVTAKQA